MTRLVYQPAFDPYNTIFRLLQLRKVVWTSSPVEFDLLRITDFYLLFPIFIKNIRLKPAHRRFKKLATSEGAAQPYARLPEESTLLKSMKPFQLAAANTLVDSGLADPEAWTKGEVVATAINVPDALKEALEKKNAQQADVLEFLGVLTSEYNFLGEDGVKHRTGLLEYRYDTV
ncbi:MAG TPA: ABC-three component system middle component 5 [Roseovarius sp.]